MNYGTEPMSSTMSPFLSGTTSPVPGAGLVGGPHQQGNNNGASSSQMPASIAMVAAMNAANSGQASPALAYANAQLAQFAQQHQHHFGNGNVHNPMQLPSQNTNFMQSNGNGHNANFNAAQFASLFNHSTGGAAPSNLNPHALSAALAEYGSQSMPNSAASSPGAQNRRLPASALGYPSGTMTGTNTPGGHSRVAASAITGKRLNWSEMICQTIAESESGHLVIQDLFTQMCDKFPEIREWAFGKDWEGRVKNRIKSTLSIKGNLFIKVPRPTSASGKGSWWTLSQEAQDAWKEGRVASIVKSGSHSRSASQGRSGFDGLSGLTMSTATSRANSRAPSRRGSPVSSRGPSSHHAQNAHQQANNQRNSQNGYVNFAQQHHDNQSNSSPSVGSQGDNGSNSRRHSPSAGLPASLGMSPITFPGAPASFEGFNMGTMSGLEAFNDPASGLHDNNAQQLSLSNMGGGGEGNLGNHFNSSNSSSSDAAMNNPTLVPSATSLGMTTMGTTAGNLYSISPYNSFSTSAAAQHLGNVVTPAHMGGPQSMPFPPAQTLSNDNAATANVGDGTAPGSGVNSAALNSFMGDPTFGAFAGLDLSNIDGLNNPFGTMAGGYTMLGSDPNPSRSAGGGGGAQPTPIPGRNGAQSGGNSAGGSGSGGRGTPSASSFNAAFYSGPSPADSTGSTSAFFAYTPAMQAADAAVGNSSSGNGGGSALGPVGGEGSRRKREMSSSVPNSDFALPPTAAGSDRTGG